MLFAQIVAPPPAPTGDAAEVREAPRGDDAGAPVKSAEDAGAPETRDYAGAPERRDDAGAPPKREEASPPPRAQPKRDETTDQPIPRRDETGQPIIPRDATGQIEQRHDETGQTIPDDEAAAPVPDSLLRPQGMLGTLGLGGVEGATLTLPGGTDYRAQIALVEGYNSNVVQTQDVIGGPVKRHPSPFTGIDASGTLRTWSSPTDEHDLRLQLRGQHYTPLEHYSQPDDGSVNLAWAGQFTLAKRTILTGRALGTVSTLNSSRLSDGPLFQVDPTSLQRSYTLTVARLALIHEIAPRWRYVQGADVEFSTTLHDAPIAVAEGSPINHRGLDYVQPGIDSALFHDIDERNIVSGKVRYAPVYNAFLLDYSRNPPQPLGKATTHLGDIEASLTHAFSERLRSLTTLGTIVSGAPPLDPDRRPIVSPMVSEEIVYSKQYWFTTLNASYSYGTTNPRLGFGPAVGAGFTMEGTPFPSGALRHLDLIVNGILTRAAFRQGPSSLSRLSLVQSSAEIRYGLNTWLGLLGGYSVRYATFEGGDTFPSLLRHIVFLGLSGYWATDRTVPSLQTFVSPVTPPG
jgi:hypothetical protein